MPLPLLVLAASAYMAVPHTEPPPGWPEMTVVIRESDQVFPDECNRSGMRSVTQFFGAGAVACAMPNPYTRTCHVIYSVNPMGSVMMAGVPGMTSALLEHELMHCEGRDHPVVGTTSLADVAKRWNEIGRPLMSREEYEAWVRDSASGDFLKPDIRARYNRSWRKWMEAGKRHDQVVKDLQVLQPSELTARVINAGIDDLERREAEAEALASASAIEPVAILAGADTR